MEFLAILLGLNFFSFLCGKKKEVVSPERKTLSEMSPREFEIFCASWLEDSGYKTEITGYVGDNNIDIYVYDQNNNYFAIAECKRWKNKVGVSAIKTLYATMLQQGLTFAWFFSVNGFSDRAISYTESLPTTISLIEGRMMI